MSPSEAALWCVVACSGVLLAYWADLAWLTLKGR